MQANPYSVYALSLSYRLTLQAHSLSNIGSNGSNRLLARRQRLADGRETDAASGNIRKHHLATLYAEECAYYALPLCPACAVGDGRRAMALLDHPAYHDLSIERIIRDCAMCDVHGFLVTPKRANRTSGDETRQRHSKHSLCECSFALAIPEHFAESSQLLTRHGTSAGDGQMIMTMPARSGTYAACMRYCPAGIGVDTQTWQMVLTDEHQRIMRHQCVLRSIRDSILSPQGALTSTMLPHVSHLVGALILRRDVGPAPIYSPLEADFIEQLGVLADETCEIHVFRSAGEFTVHMNNLIMHSVPAIPRTRGGAPIPSGA